MNFLTMLLVFAFSIPSIAWPRVRRIETKPDQVITVKTAIGIATIIQVPDRPNSIVVGDQAGFKVEYLDQAITIKPLHGGAKSNLYIYTDFRRFNVQLVTTTEPAADYVVYLDIPKAKEKSSKISWSKFRNRLKNDDLAVETKRLAQTSDGVLLVEFEITSVDEMKFRPEWIWLTQKGETKPIHGLLLSSQSLDEKSPVRGVMQILKSDISLAEPLKFEVRRKKSSYLSIPKVNSWK